ncbi:MAG: LPS-assembly protein LptD [Gammaproteobacteria bacterium]
MKPIFQLTRILVITTCLLILVPVSALSAPGSSQEWGLCDHYQSRFGEDILNPDEQTVLKADIGSASASEIYTLEGNIQIMRNNQLIGADKAVYKKSTDKADATGNVEFQTKGMQVNGESASIQLGTNRGHLNQPEYTIHDRHARGYAQTAFFNGPDLTILEQASYTTCDVGDSSWFLRSSQLTLDHKNGIGSAKHVRVSFKEVPFFYLPYISFPISDKRKSGFLMPSFESSSTSGEQVAIPYYLNIAPDLDATLTPQFISERGTLLKSELRYLRPMNHGKINIEHISNDELFGEDRSALYYRHSGSLSKNIHTDINLNYVSDTDYLEELGNSLSITSVTHLEQRADLTYVGESWQLGANLQGYQTVDESIPNASRPYQRLPQIYFDNLEGNNTNTINTIFKGELVNFERKDQLSGIRIKLQPGISYPMSNIAMYFTPRLDLRYNGYELRNQSPGDNSFMDNTIPIFSVDSGIFLERDTNIGTGKYLQTLEPRLQYVYIPYEDQSDIPLFDSGQPDFNFTQLFVANRFSGSDRLGDTNHLSVSITSRLYHAESGRERGLASIGQRFYFQNRKVMLSGAGEEVGRESDIIALFHANLTDSLSTDLDLRWDNDIEEIDKGTLRFQYHPSARRVLNLAYRYQNTALEQTDMSVLWPIGRNWRFVGRWNRSLPERKDLETLSGFEYQTCCWKLQMAMRRFVTDTAEESNNTFFVQLELKGLTSFGRSIDEILETGILGYAE